MEQDRKPVYPAFLACLSMAYLLWFDARTVRFGYYEWICFPGKAASTAAVLFAAAFIYAIMRTMRHRSCRIILIPSVLFLIYISRLLEGKDIYASDFSDFSVTENIELKETGIWRRSYFAGPEAETHETGTFEVKNDTVYLYHNLGHINLSVRGRLVKIKKRGIAYKEMPWNDTGIWPDEDKYRR